MVHIVPQGHIFCQSLINQCFFEDDYLHYVAPCRPVEVYRRFIGDYCLHRIAAVMEAVRASETSVKFYQTIRCNIPENIFLRCRRRENRKSHPVFGYVVVLVCVTAVLISFVLC